MADGKVVYKIEADLTAYDQGLKDASAKAQAAGGDIGTSFDEAGKKAGQSAKQAGTEIGEAYQEGGAKAAKESESAAAKITDAYKKSAVVIGAAVAAVVGAGVGYNAELEQYTASFETMMGSYADAVNLVDELKQKAAATPFELTDLTEVTQLLMNYGLTAEDATEKMSILGDIAQGNADKMNRIATAYGQMSSAGKVSLEDVKQMIEAGFNPLLEISNKTGESMDSLYDRISKGEVAVDEITEAMRSATSAGGKYYQSMERQSKTLLGQWSTLGDTAKEAFGKATSGINAFLAEDALPAAINAISWFGDNIETIIPILGAATASVTAFVIAANFSKITTGISNFIGAIATASNPITLAVTGITALVTGLMAVNTIIENSKPQFDEYDAEIESITDSLKSLAQETEQSKIKTEESTSQIEAASGKANTWIARLKELENKTSLTTAEQKEWNAILQKLEGTIPGVSELINDQTGELEGGTSALEDYVAGWKDAAKIEIYTDRINEALERVVEAEGKLVESKILLDEIMATPGAEEQVAYMKEVEEQFNITGVSIQSVVDRMSMIVATTRGANDEMFNFIERGRELINANGDMIPSIEELISAQENANIQIEENNAIVDTEIEKKQELIDKQAAVAESAEAEAEAIEAATERQEEALARRVEVTQNAFEKVESTINLTAQEMIDNLQSNQELVEQWTQNLATITERGLDSGLLQMLEEAGPAAAETVQNLVNASDAEIQELNDVFRNGGEDAVRVLLETLSLPDVQESGKNAIDNVAEGVLTNPALENAARQTVQDTKNTFMSSVRAAGFTTVGEQVINGIQQGLLNKRSSLMATAQSIANDISTTINGALDINSPSGVGEEIGLMFDAGIDVGLLGGKKKIEESAEQVSNSLIGGLYPAMLQSTAAINNTYYSQSQNTSSSVSSIVNRIGQGGQGVTITKLADTVVVREEADIDKISTALYRKFITEKRIRGVY